MAGIYIHIPFCKKKCYYCDFYSVVSRKDRELVVSSIIKELLLRKDYLANENINTIYFGGGTPSVLSKKELSKILNSVYNNYNIDDNAEITFEANPDDLSDEYLQILKQNKINRLSIGVQSFFDDDLKLMNRSHDATTAEESIKRSIKVGFANFSIDLIYGLPNLSLDNWKKNIDKAISLNPTHISAYHLTYEPNTVFYKFLKDKKIIEIPDSESIEQFKILINETKKAGFEHYEISNFAKPNYISKHNSNYWKQQKYIGIGPSAHSYNLESRQWNYPSNKKYTEGIINDKQYFDKEILSITDKYNEYILTSIRTYWGINTNYISDNFGNKYLSDFEKNIQEYINNGYVKSSKNIFTLANSGLFISDKIAGDLFFEE